ncbi:MAG: hypothetical protein M3430_21000 [Acidobacteriota bacterium]|nr:hypothetical protein [Acidobacteriota bacterium]
MAKSHLFIIEIPRELQLSEEEIATLEGHFQVDAGNLLDARESGEPPIDDTNVNTVRVQTRLQPTAGKSASRSSKKSGKQSATRKSAKRSGTKAARKAPRK